MRGLGDAAKSLLPGASLNEILGVAYSTLGDSRAAELTAKATIPEDPRPQLLWSRTHSVRGDEGCLLEWRVIPGQSGPAVQGVGIDLERADRPISGALKSRLAHPEEYELLTPIELWCLKEAALKADQRRPSALVSQYKVVGTVGGGPGTATGGVEVYRIERAPTPEVSKAELFGAIWREGAPGGIGWIVALAWRTG